ncbi:tetratricopeptide repeat-containing sensor histidine kinase [Winogradskyella bathintestinalis]|uniref:histidine kinase n=1 Tax=Winogradskyella bathintestinalis TaxID=3035208 RepID=A0ABT7ZQI3_9FLAO|nr:tetratricopeptide repeat-containing sensor histidine kinase [Winogradskyella bathintestinalis]MDN3491268.1 tetratricopeptide repeat protein [Winogradskyella bathintestinalis]
MSSNSRLSYSIKASTIASEMGIDSLVLRANRDLSFNYLINGDFDNFKNVSLKNLNLAQKLRDSSAIAYTNKNLGWYYYEISEDNTAAYQHFIKALDYFSIKAMLKQKAEVLFSIAAIQDQEKDYLGSEQNAIEALRLYNKLNYRDILSDRYRVTNHLGKVSYKLENYDKSIDYHNQAINLTKKIDDSRNLYLESLHNLALPYRAKHNYDKALGIYNELSGVTSLKEEDIMFYALILGNYAFTKFLEGNYEYENLEKDFKRALKIADSIDDSYTKLAISIDLAKFYKTNAKRDSALVYAKESYKISGAIPINELYLESMLLLADLTKGNLSKKYLEKHILLSDSLLKNERKVRNKFARIAYETDQLEAKNKQISKENLYLLILSIGLLLTVILVYVIISQRAKNRKLALVQTQQKANEDIYNLMLGQQDKVDEARAKEKIRVSKELHDGVLGALFGVRLSLDSINFNEGKEAMMTRAKYISQLQTIEQEIRKISHELNTDFVAGSGFIDIIEELIEMQTVAYNLNYEFNSTDDISWDLVSNKIKINIYRIIQECMQNIYKHANAKIIEISISLKKNLICLDIIDDGDGFDISKKKKGIGLKNIKSRVEDIDGQIDFISKSTHGTKVSVTIPYINQSK